jgi:hypothetical protein
LLLFQVTVQEVKRITWNSEVDTAAAPAAGVGPSIPWQEVVGWKIAQVHSLEAELGVAHDMEYGITWDEDLEQ